MDTDKTSGKIPATLQKEIRSKLGALGIKLTIAAEELQAETDAARIKELRDQIIALKAEAKTVVEKYRWAKSTYAEDPSAQAKGGVPEMALDGLLVFGELDLDAPGPPMPSVSESSASLDDEADVALVLDLAGMDGMDGTDGEGAAPILPVQQIEDGTVLIDEVDFSLNLAEEAEAALREPTARGGRLGLALGMAAELANGREAEWGGPLMVALLDTVSLALAGGADEEEASAAALYAAIDIATEDQTLQDIREHLGDRVVELVAWCAWMLRIDPWEQRDRAYMTRLQSAPSPAIFVSTCGRLVAARAMLVRKAISGTGSLDRPGRERERLVWSLRALVKAYRSVADAALLGRILDEWEQAVEAVGQRLTGG